MCKWNRNMCSFFWPELFHAHPISGLHPFSLCPATLLWSLWVHISNPHWNSGLIEYLTTLLLARMPEQVTDLIEHIFRLLGGGGTTCISSTCFYSSALSPVFPQLISPFFREHLFRLPQLCLKEGCSNNLLPTARINLRFIPQNILSSTSAEGWTVSLEVGLPFL